MAEMDETVLKRQRAFQKMNKGKYPEVLDYGSQNLDYTKKPINITGDVSDMISDENITPPIKRVPQEQPIVGGALPVKGKGAVVDQQTAAPEAREQGDLGSGSGSGYNWDWGEILIGAVPSLLGYMAGDPAAGYAIGGQGLVDRQKQLIDLNTERLKNLRSKAGKDTLKPVRMPDGSVKYIRESQAEGMPVGYSSQDLETYARRKDIARESDIKEYEAKGQNFQIKADEDGVLQRIDRKTGEKFPVGSISGLSPVAGKYAKHYVDQYNKAIDKDLESYSDLEQNFKSLLDNNQLGNKTAVMGIVKDIETRLSDYDRTYYTGEISEARQLRARAQQLSTNKMNPRLLKDAMGLIGRFLHKKKKRISDKRMRFSSQLKGARPELNKEQIENVFGVLPNMTKGTYMKKGDEVIEVPWNEVQEYLEKKYKVLRGL